MAFDSAGNLYIANCGNGSVARIDQGTVDPYTHQTTSYNCLGGIAISPSDEIFVSTWTQGAILKIGDVSPLVTVLSDPDALAYDAAETFGTDYLLYVVERGTGNITRINPSNGSTEVFATGFSSPFGITFSKDGCLYVSEFGEDKIWRIGLNDGNGGVICPDCIACGVCQPEINIKPYSWPNAVNTCSQGSTPVIIWGSNLLDVYKIDLDSLTFGDKGLKVVGKGNKSLFVIDDFGQPTDDPDCVGVDGCDGIDPTPDGYDDLNAKFDTYELGTITNGTKTFAKVCFDYDVNGDFDYETNICVEQEIFLSKECE